eukprot:jgi/Astpho2/58/Aster-x0422
MLRKSSILWPSVQQLRLTINERVRRLQGQDQQQQAAFADYLLQDGEGREPTFPDIGQDVVRLKDSMCLPWDSGVSALVQRVYGNQCSDPDFLMERSILAPRNVDVEDINSYMLHRWAGQEHCYASADSVVDDDHAAAERPEPVEVLNSMTPDSMPPHIVKLKAGCMVMLMRNVHKDLGLVNGARLFVRDFQPRCVECEIAGGVHKGRRVFIPRMVFTSDDEVSSEDSIVVLAKKGSHHGKQGVYTNNLVYKEALS